MVFQLQSLQWQTDLKNVAKIRQTLEQGGIALLPMATVYSLVVHGERPEAIAALRRLKGFNHDQPLAVLSRGDRAEEVAIITPAGAKMLPLFPCPITLILPARPHLDPGITLNFANLFMACPDPAIYDLIGVLPFPLVAGTAKIGGEAITSFPAAQRYFGEQVDLIIDGGPCYYSRRGTLIDCTLEYPTIMNFGPISVDDLRPFVPDIILPSHLMK